MSGDVCCGARLPGVAGEPRKLSCQLCPGVAPVVPAGDSGIKYPAWHLVTVPCTTCDTGSPVAVAPGWVKRARCGACVQAGTPYRGDLVSVPVRPVVGKRVDIVIPPRPAPKLTRADVTLPPPEWDSRSPWPEDVTVPGPVVKLRAFAVKAGWETRLQYARGSKFGVGTAVRVVHGVALRMADRASERAAVVLYEAKVSEKITWTIDVVWVYGRDCPPYGHLGVADLRTYLAEAPGWDTVTLARFIDRHRMTAQEKVTARKAEEERRKQAGIGPKRKAKEGAS